MLMDTLAIGLLLSGALRLLGLLTELDARACPGVRTR
jgi:hypothetical protein